MAEQGDAAAFHRVVLGFLPVPDHLAGQEDGGRAFVQVRIAVLDAKVVHGDDPVAGWRERREVDLDGAVAQVALAPAVDAEGGNAQNRSLDAEESIGVAGVAAPRCYRPCVP